MYIMEETMYFQHQEFQWIISGLYILINKMELGWYGLALGGSTVMVRCLAGKTKIIRPSAGK